MPKGVGSILPWVNFIVFCTGAGLSEFELAWLGEEADGDDQMMLDDNEVEAVLGGDCGVKWRRCGMGSPRVYYGGRLEGSC